MKRALISGSTGQDGSWLTEFLLARGYEIHGIVRRETPVGSARLHVTPLDDPPWRQSVFAEVQPEEYDHLAAENFTAGVGQIFAGATTNPTPGNLDAERDWGHARDFVELAFRCADLGWSPAASFQELVGEMVAAERLQPAAAR